MLLIGFDVALTLLSVRELLIVPRMQLPVILYIHTLTHTEVDTHAQFLYMHDACTFSPPRSPQFTGSLRAGTEAPWR